MTITDDELGRIVEYLNKLIPGRDYTLINRNVSYNIYETGVEISPLTALEIMGNRTRTLLGMSAIFGRFIWDQDILNGAQELLAILNTRHMEEIR